jgi:hypothetical protein
MSELMNTTRRSSQRWQLFVTASSFALMALGYGTPLIAKDVDEPTVWIDLGGQLERVSGAGLPFTPDFLLNNIDAGPFVHTQPIKAQSASRYSFGGEGSIAFSPSDSNWVFSVSARIGRANGHRRLHQQTDAKVVRYSRLFGGDPQPWTHTQPVENFAQVKTNNTSSQTILDFKVGKDVGLGMFGGHGTSTFELGVRFAQFGVRTDATIRARPSYEVYNPLSPPSYIPKYKFMTYAFAGSAQRSFHGIGPSLSWEGSTPFAGNLHDGQFDLDWGIGGALLFGRQKANIFHQTTGRYYRGKYTKPLDDSPIPTHYTTPIRTHKAPSRAKSVTVPNLGGFAGISYRIENFKMSAGYRVDYFFGAMDGGIDVRKSNDLCFHGPYARISIGLGG